MIKIKDNQHIHLNEKGGLEVWDSLELKKIRSLTRKEEREILKLEKQKMKVVCAWCKVIIKEGDGKVSHGICKECYKKYFKEEK